MSSYRITFRAEEQREPLTVEADGHRIDGQLIYFFDLVVLLDTELPAKLIVNVGAVATIEMLTVTFRRYEGAHASAPDEAAPEATPSIGSMIDELDLQPQLQSNERIHTAVVVATITRPDGESGLRYRTAALAPSNIDRLAFSFLMEAATEQLAQRSADYRT